MIFIWFRKFILMFLQHFFFFLFYCGKELIVEEERSNSGCVLDKNYCVEEYLEFSKELVKRKKNLVNLHAFNDETSWKRSHFQKLLSGFQLLFIFGSNIIRRTNHIFLTASLPLLIMHGQQASFSGWIFKDV